MSAEFCGRGANLKLTYEIVEPIDRRVVVISKPFANDGSEELSFFIGKIIINRGIDFIVMLWYPAWSAYTMIGRFARLY